MILLPLMLAACNPEHNPGDLAQIDQLEAHNADLNRDLTSARAETESVQDQLAVARAELEAFMIVGQAWYVANKQPVGAELVVCYPDEFIPEGALDPTLPLPRTQPWVQSAVTNDCGEPMVLSLVVTREEDATEPLAQAGEGYDGPTISNAPSDDEEDPE